MNINLFGIPSAAGALYEGTEEAPTAIRNAGLVEDLSSRGFTIKDLGDLIFEKSLPRHNIGPVRNWPAPRLVWEAIVEKGETLFSPDAFTIILGGDCSIEVGTFTSFRKIFGEESYLLVLDGHVDTVPPQGKHCIGAAGMGLWFLTQDHQVWWNEQPLSTDKIKIIGTHSESGDSFGMDILPFEEISNVDGLSKVMSLMEKIPKDAKILVHLDVDVLHESIMPSAYSPSSTGLDLMQAVELLRLILRDNRVKGIEVSEFSANKDLDGTSAKLITDLLLLISERKNMVEQP